MAFLPGGTRLVIRSAGACTPNARLTLLSLRTLREIGAGIRSARRPRIAMTATALLALDHGTGCKIGNCIRWVRPSYSAGRDRAVVTDPTRRNRRSWTT